MWKLDAANLEVSTDAAEKPRARIALVRPETPDQNTHQVPGAVVTTVDAKLLEAARTLKEGESWRQRAMSRDDAAELRTSETDASRSMVLGRTDLTVGSNSKGSRALAQGTIGPQPEQEPSLPDLSKWGAAARASMNQSTGLGARGIADGTGQLHRARRGFPHVTHHDLADITDLEAARQRYLKQRSHGEPELTIAALAVKAATVVLKSFPRIGNVDRRSGKVLAESACHIGLAMTTELGLMVPVIRDADRKTTRALAAEMAALVARAHGRTLEHAELEGATFTVTMADHTGNAWLTSIRGPAAAALGLSRPSIHQVEWEGTMADRLFLPLSLAYDHRVIEGSEAARFIRAVAALLADPIRLVMEC